MELTVHQRDETANFVDADVAGDTFRNNGDTEALIFNMSGVARTVTVPAQSKCKHGFLDDLQVTIPAGTLHRMGPFPQSRFGNSQTIVQLQYDDPTGISVAIQKLR